MRTQSSFDDIDLRGLDRSGSSRKKEPPSGRIHVLTAIDQEVEVERKADSDCESTRDLVRDKGMCERFLGRGRKGRFSAGW